MYPFEKVDKRLLGEQIENELLRFIREEPVEIGGRLPNEFELGEKFGVGRSTIREAIKSLVSHGVLEVRRGSGTYVVSHYSLKEDPLGLSRLEDKFRLALELSEVRLLLEPETAASAARSAAGKDIIRLREICDEAERACLSGENRALADMEFHTHIAHCSGNRVAEALIPAIVSASLMSLDLMGRVSEKEAIGTYRAVAEAIAGHDPLGARCAMTAHLTCCRRALQNRIKEGRQGTEK